MQTAEALSVTTLYREWSPVVLSELERTVLDVLLDGDDPDLAILRAQYAEATVETREHTDTGLVISLAVSPDVPKTSRSALRIGDVCFDLESSDAGGEAILWVRGGVLDELELLARDGAWPADARVSAAQYFGGARDLGTLREGWV